MEKRSRQFCIALVTWFVLFGVGAADGATPPLSFIHSEGTKLIDENGRQIILRGCNLGNWLMFEPWMFGGCLDARDQAQIFSVWQRRFGADGEKRLLDLYRGGYVTDRDFATIKTFGFNVVRLPLNYRMFQDDQPPYPIRADAFVWVDRALAMAEAAGIYVVLDLHGAPGGQSNDMPTGQVGRNQLWTSPLDQQRTAAIWRAIARRYHDRAVVAAYDLLNEPYGDFKQDIRDNLASLMPVLYEAIRAEDDRHVMFFSAALRGGIEFYGNPHRGGRHDVGFTEHFYAGLFGDKPEIASHARVLEKVFPQRQAFLDRVEAPYYVGEFNVVNAALGGVAMMRLYYDTFARHGWAGTMWSYKILSRRGGFGRDSWCMVTNSERLPRLNLNGSSFEDFERFFEGLKDMKLTVDEPLRRALTERVPRSDPLSGISSPR